MAKPKNATIAVVVLLAHLAVMGLLLMFGEPRPSSVLPVTVAFERASGSAEPHRNESSSPGPAASRAPPARKKAPSFAEPAAATTASLEASPSDSTLVAAVSTPALLGSSASSAFASEPSVRAQAIDDRLPLIDASFTGNRLPEYPAMSRRLGEQGIVVLRVLIGTDGRAGDIQLMRSSGSERLDQSAMRAIAQWRFVPALRGGRPVAAWYEWQWEFRLGS